MTESTLMTASTLRLNILGLLSRAYGQDFDLDDETFDALVEDCVAYDMARAYERSIADADA